MEVIPALSFRNNTPVIVKNGRYEQYSKDGITMDVWGVLEQLGDYEKIYFLDLDGIEANKLQSEIIRKLATRKEVWADVGASDTETITDAYIAGADRVVISTKTMRSVELIEKSSLMSGQMIFCLDYKDNTVSYSNGIENMRPETLIQSAIDVGIDTIIVHDLSDEKFNYDLINYLPEGDYKLFIGGNVSDIDENTYEDIVDGIILGLEDSIEWHQRN